jgi:tetratricopeptide (TPR) repeat protein
VPLRSAEIARAHEPTVTHPDVRALILRAMPLFWAHRPEANARAVELLTEALALDPDNTRARAYKAWALIQKPSYMWSDDPAADREAALALAEAAAGTVGDDPPALVAISAAYSMGVAGHSPAIGFARRALAIDPSNAWGHMRLGWGLVNEDLSDEALAAFDHARRLSPLDPFLFNMNIGTAVARARQGRYDLAIPLLEETLLSVPGVTWAYRLLAGFYARAGDPERATSAADKLLKAYPGLTIEQLESTLPPSSMIWHDPAVLDGLRRAGIPDR